MTKFSRRQAATLMAGAIVAPFAAPAIVSARSSQTIFIIVPYASGGSIDSLMRSIAKGMSEASTSRFWSTTSRAPTALSDRNM